MGGGLRWWSSIAWHGIEVVKQQLSMLFYWWHSLRLWWGWRQYGAHRQPESSLNLPKESCSHGFEMSPDWMLGKTFFCSEVSGQASVEAAALLPTIMIVILMLLQPACLLYTRSVMRSAAAQTARVVATASSENERECKEYALRRLQAIPNVSIFHEGGPRDWDIQISGLGEAEVCIEISGSVKPLPVIGGLTAALGASDHGTIQLHVEVTEQVRPEWLEGNYEDWVGAWDS